MSKVNEKHQKVVKYLYKRSAELRNIPLQELEARGKREEKANTIHLIRYILFWGFPELSYNEIAQLTKAKDHSTIFNSVRKQAPMLIEMQRSIREFVATLIQEVSGIKHECRACKFYQEPWCGFLSSKNKHQVSVEPDFSCMQFQYHPDINMSDELKELENAENT